MSRQLLQGPDDRLRRAGLRRGQAHEFEISKHLDPYYQAMTGMGLQLSSGWRSPEHNESVGGASNSWHMQDAGGGALDFTGSPEAMQAGRAWALANGAREAMIHDAGSGNHLHTAWASGQTPPTMTGTPVIPTPQIPGRPVNRFTEFISGAFPQGIPPGADINAAYEAFLQSAAPAANGADAAAIFAQGGIPMVDVPAPEIVDLVYTPTDTSGVEDAFRGVGQAQTAVDSELAARRQKEFEVGNRTLLSRMLGPELFRLMSGGQFQSRLPEEEQLVQSLFAKAREAEESAMRSEQVGAAQTDAQIANLRFQSGQADEGRRAQYDQINTARALDRYGLETDAVNRWTDLSTQIGLPRLAAGLQQQEGERDRAFQLLGQSVAADSAIDGMMFDAELQRSMFGAKTAAELAIAQAEAAGKKNSNPQVTALLDAMGQYETRANTARERAGDLTSGLDSFFNPNGGDGSFKGHDNFAFGFGRGPNLTAEEASTWGRIEGGLDKLYERQTTLESEEAALVGKMRAAGADDAQVADAQSRFAEYRRALDGLEPPQRDNESQRDYLARMQSWYQNGGKETLGRIAEVEESFAAPSPGTADPARAQSAGTSFDAAGADLEAEVQALENDAAVADSLDALVGTMPPVGTGLTREQARMRDRRIAESLAADGLMIDAQGRVVVMPESMRPPQTSTGMVY